MSVRNFILAGLATVALAGGHKKRAESSSFSLYAYGDFNQSGSRVFYADGAAYVGSGPPSGASESHNVTFSLNSTSITITPEDTSGNFTGGQMYVNNGTSASEPVGFGDKGNISSSDASSGFGLYGAWLYHAKPDGTLEMYFFVESTDDADVFALKWNGAGTNPSDGISVAVRTTPPSKPSDATT